MPAVKNPATDIRNSEGALFVFDMISMIDGDFFANPYEHQYKIDMNNKGFLRGIIMPEYKYARYFSPVEFNTPYNIDDLYKYNEVEMYRMGSDETDNLAYPKGNNETTVMQYNALLNNLIIREIGTDNGRETEAYIGGLLNYAK